MRKEEAFRTVKWKPKIPRELKMRACNINFSHWNDKFRLFSFFLSPHSSNKWRSCTARKRNRSEFREIYIEAIKLHIFTLCLACASVEYSDKCTRCGVKKTWRALEETFWATPLSASRYKGSPSLPIQQFFNIAQNAFDIPPPFLRTFGGQY